MRKVENFQCNYCGSCDLFYELNKKKCECEKSCKKDSSCGLEIIKESISNLKGGKK